MLVFTYDCIVIGTGAAGYNAACRLKQAGVNVAIVTEGVKTGTSRNTGSDKQTYYKLGLGGDTLDSVRNMAEDLFRGGCVDGDNALCEAALSSRCFLNLCELGVEFPINRYGEYPGYKTDHDPYARATSAGPLTSKYMTEALERQAQALGVEIFDACLAVEILKDEDGVCGLVCCKTDTGKHFAFRTRDVIMATGGPGGIFADSVYPECHTGSTSLALAAGAKAQNLAMWQFGLASVRPRWNISGTYMQVLPRVVSIDENGVEREFLAEHFDDVYEALSLLFLKGYQWPFDPKKAEHGSSQIDILVYNECTVNRRRVFLDYTKNPFGIDKIDFKRLSAEAYEYLLGAEALFGTPIERLEKMNMPAVELYRGKGVDLTCEMLEIAFCAQHNNGGVAVDAWWQSSVRGLFAIGECAGTHGISRPGGSALNAGQVGGVRAAQYISRYPGRLIDEDSFKQLLAEKGDYKDISDDKSEPYVLDRRITSAQRRMSDCAGAVRDRKVMKDVLERVTEEYKACAAVTCVADYKLRDILLTQAAVLCAMTFEESFDGGDVVETVLTDTGFVNIVRPVRPIPTDDGVFENIWRGYRENGNIY